MHANAPSRLLSSLVAVAILIVNGSVVGSDSANKSAGFANRAFLPACIWDGYGWELRDASTDEVVISRLEMAVSFRARRIGLQRRSGLAQNSGLLLAPANAIHTRRMCFPIDLIYLDRCGQIIAIRRNVPPWRRLSRVCGAYAVLETAAEEYELRIGQRLYVARAPA